jgi:hypothetical protein
MKETILAAGLLVLAMGVADGADAQFEARPTPEFAPLVERVCLPLVKGGKVADAAGAARTLAFAETARNASMVTLERNENLSLTVGPAYCYVSLAYSSPSHFMAVERELRGWLPRLGRYWAGRIDGDVLGMRARKFRAGGITVTLEEQVDEYGRRLNMTMTP